MVRKKKQPRKTTTTTFKRATMKNQQTGQAGKNQKSTPMIEDWNRCRKTTKYIFERENISSNLHKAIKPSSTLVVTIISNYLLATQPCLLPSTNYSTNSLDLQQFIFNMNLSCWQFCPFLHQHLSTPLITPTNICFPLRQLSSGMSPWTAITMNVSTSC